MAFSFARGGRVPRCSVGPWCSVPETETWEASGWALGPALPISYHGGDPESRWPFAARLASRTMLLPCHSFVTPADVDIICQTLLLIMKQTVFSRGSQ